MEIAVLVDSEGKTSGFEKNGSLCIYSKENGAWFEKKCMEHDLKGVINADILREKIKDICDWLEDCKILVVNRIRGVHYIGFEERQVSMLEIEGKPEQFLDDIKECWQHQRTGQKVPLEHNAIHEQRQGIFYTDLREVMKGNTSYNSKQILLPFLKKQKFKSLEIICDHVPKWLEKEMFELSIMISVEKYKDCMKVKVHPVKGK
ncbi:Fe-only nitrogenase accessory AnfO family protein [Anaerosporobacter sp.]